MSAPVAIIVSTGATYTATVTNVFIGFNSPDGVDKTLVIPPSSGSLSTIVVADVYGSAGMYPIMITPATGDIVGNQNQIDISHESLTFLDSPVGWIAV